MKSHSHTLQFAGSDKTYRHGTVDFFDATCPICEAVSQGREPAIEFIQPAPGAPQSYLTVGQRAHRWIMRRLLPRWSWQPR